MSRRLFSHDQVQMPNRVHAQESYAQGRARRGSTQHLKARQFFSKTTATTGRGTWLTRRQTNRHLAKRSTRLREGGSRHVEELSIIDLSHLAWPVARAWPVFRRDETHPSPFALTAWIGYPRKQSRPLNPAWEALYAWPTNQRMPNLLVVSVQQQRQVDDFRLRKSGRTHPASSDATRSNPIVLVVQIAVRAVGDPLLHRAIAAMGAPLRGARPSAAEWEAIVRVALLRNGRRWRMLGDRGTSCHNVLAGNSSSTVREFLNLLRFLGNELTTIRWSGRHTRCLLGDSARNDQWKPLSSR